MATKSENDKKQIGLTPKAAMDLTAIMETGWFIDRQDAYRTAIAVALGLASPAAEAEMANITTAYNFVGGVDKDGQLRSLISALAPGESSRPAAYAERLAQSGLSILAERLADDSASISEALAPIVQNDESVNS